MREFKVPVHAVDIELEIPGRFSVKEVWELEDESAADHMDALEGNMVERMRNTEFLQTDNHGC